MIKYKCALMTNSIIMIVFSCNYFTRNYHCAVEFSHLTGSKVFIFYNTMAL